MTDTEIRAAAEEFAALPRAERRAKFPTLPKPVKLAARKMIESRRGIAYRAEGGVPVFTKDEYIRQILQKTAKADDMSRREEVTRANVVELKKQLQENWGDEALAEAENALEEANE